MGEEYGEVVLENKSDVGYDKNMLGVKKNYKSKRKVIEGLFYDP